ncbi:MAG: TIGR04282 family arsenosugar biosynthesis glycosyltransferase [Acidobacteria bacterium]|nr:TIGR04282 family arsenosugar biosynthesis glycosyltransferase [Acidobacteriota bacterium]
MSHSALLVFAKVPEPGRVKTRLFGALTPQQAAEAGRACLSDTVLQAGRVAGCRLWLQVAAPLDRAAQLANSLALDARWRVGVQRGRNLGERFHAAFDSLFRAGCRKVICVGTDTPWMGRRRILRAMELLDSADVVLGPSADGGYYLVGARRRVPRIFRDIPWSTSQVFGATLRALQKAGASYRLLPRDFDLDRPEDLARAAALLGEDAQRAPALARFLQELKLDSATRSSRRRPPARRRRTRRPGRG